MNGNYQSGIHASCSMDIAIDYEIQDKIEFLRGQMDNKRQDQMHSLIWAFVFHQQNAFGHIHVETKCQDKILNRAS